MRLCHHWSHGTRIINSPPEMHEKLSKSFLEVDVYITACTINIQIITKLDVRIYASPISLREWSQVNTWVWLLWRPEIYTGLILLTWHMPGSVMIIKLRFCFHATRFCLLSTDRNTTWGGEYWDVLSPREQLPAAVPSLNALVILMSAKSTVTGAGQFLAQLYALGYPILKPLNAPVWWDGVKTYLLYVLYFS